MTCHTQSICVAGVFRARAVCECAVGHVSRMNASTGGTETCGRPGLHTACTSNACLDSTCRRTLCRNGHTSSRLYLSFKLYFYTHISRSDKEFFVFFFSHFYYSYWQSELFDLSVMLYNQKRALENNSELIVANLTFIFNISDSRSF